MISRLFVNLVDPHLMANPLSRLSNQTEPIRIFDRTHDAHLFTLQLEWLQNVYEYLLEGVMP
jgi:hypothetical protein